MERVVLYTECEESQNMSLVQTGVQSFKNRRGKAFPKRVFKYGIVALNPHLHSSGTIGYSLL